MHRPWQIGVVFVACLAVVLAALGWTSHQVLRLDRQATQEEAARLALWRMESALVSLVAQEATRPYFEYSPLYSPARSYARMYNKDAGKGEVLIPSSILVQSSPYIRLHFQIGPDGALTSPQAPGEVSAKGSPALAYTTRDEIEKAEARLASLKPLLGAAKLAADLPGPADRPLPATTFAVAAAPNLDAQNPAVQQQAQINQPAAQQEAIPQGQAMRNIKEYQARAQTFQNMATNTLNPSNEAGGNRFAALGDVREGVMKASGLTANSSWPAASPSADASTSKARGSTGPPSAPGSWRASRTSCRRPPWRPCGRRRPRPGGLRGAAATRAR